MSSVDPHYKHTLTCPGCKGVQYVTEGHFLAHDGTYACDRCGALVVCVNTNGVYWKELGLLPTSELTRSSGWQRRKIARIRDQYRSKELIAGLGGLVGCAVAASVVVLLAWLLLSALRWAWDNPVFK
jgi:hypothetical protein